MARQKSSSMDDGGNLDSVQLVQTENADSSQDWREHGSWSERKTRCLITGVIIELLEIAFSDMSACQPVQSKSSFFTEWQVL